MRGPGGEGAALPALGICSELGDTSTSAAAPDAAGGTMSRRKQAKPQHLHSGAQGPAAGGELKDCRGDVGCKMSAKRCRTEETQVCERCCAEFVDLSQFIQHKKNCSKPTPFLIMNDREGALFTDGFPESSLNPFPNDTDSRSAKDFQTQQSHDLGEKNGFQTQRSHDLGEKNDFQTQRSRDLGEKNDFQTQRSHDLGENNDFQTQRSHDLGENDFQTQLSHDLGEKKDFQTRRSHDLGGKVDFQVQHSHELREPKKEVVQTPVISESTACQKTTPQSTPSPPALSFLPKPKVPNTNVTLQTIHGTKVAVNQHTADGISPSAASLNAIPMILEQLVCLQQQQLQQIQLTEQIRIQIAMMAPHALHPSIAAATDPLKALGAHLSQQLSAAVALIGQKANNQSLSLESLRHGQGPPPNTGMQSAGTRPIGHSSSSLKPEASRIFQNGFVRLPNPVLPQSPSTVISQNPLSAMISAMDPSRKGKPPNISVPDNRPNPDESFFRHKCKFCGKVFGNDSALQIHLRSHTGERPFKCNICGNRFTTKGNLKVHFQRHRDKYPYIRMNPYPVPEHLDNIPTSSGIPYGMSVPLDESNVLVDIKPTMTLPIGLNLSQNVPLIAGIKDSTSGPLASRMQARPSAGSDGGSSSGMVNHGSATEHRFHSFQANCFVGGFNKNEPRSETSKLQQLVENIDRSSRDPNECLICHRVLSCQSSLKMHYRIHTGERPFKCKLCGRAFSTKGNLKTHYGVHRANTPLKMQHSCPICQKKFTNAVVLQQHIRMHMGGQIPNTPLPEGASENPALDPTLPDENNGELNELNNNSFIDAQMEALDMEEEDDDLESPETQSVFSKPPTPKSETRSDSPAMAFSGVAALEQQITIVNSSLPLDRLNSVKSSEMGSLDSDGMTNDSSSLGGDQEFQNGRGLTPGSPTPSESASYPVPSPPNSQGESMTSKSPFYNGQEIDVSLTVQARNPDNRQMDHHMAPNGDGALDLTSGNFGRKVIKEEPGLYFSNGDHGKSSAIGPLRPPPALVKLEMSSDRPIGTMPFNQSVLSPLMVPPRRSAKQHICNTCGKNFSSASALQIHERTHTGEKPFACTICGRAFTTKGNLKVHVGTHMWNNAARRGRRLSIDNPIALLGNDTRMPEMFPKDMVPPSMNIDPQVWNQYAAVLTSGLAMKTNEISVIQSGGIPTLPVSIGGGSVVNNASVAIDGSQSGMSHAGMNHAGMTHALAEMEKASVDNLQKRQFPHFMEENNIAVS